MILPSDLGLLIPSWRPGQLEAILQSVGSRKRFAAHCMPTGGGKTDTLLGEALLAKKRTLILTGSKALQKQYVDLHKNLNLLSIKGKSNYDCIATELGGEFYDHSPVKSVAEGPCQYGAECSLRSYGCTYYDLVRRATFEKLVVANYAAAIYANMYTEGWGYFPLVICDEAHEVETWLAKAVSIEIANLYERALNIKFPSVDDPVIWANWSFDVTAHIKELLKEEKFRVSNTRGKLKHQSRVKLYTMADNLFSRLRSVNEEWIVVRSKDKVLLHPVLVHKYAEGLLFRGAGKVVFASSTIVPKSIYSLGVKKDELDFFDYPSNFPVSRRPIYYYPIVKMHYGMEEDEDLRWIGAIDDIISKRLDRKGFIPTVSFSLQKKLLQYSKYSSLMIANSSGASSATTLQQFKAAPAPAILVTPSMGTGVDLHGKLCEYTIVPKMPFRNIYDPVLVAQQEHDADRGVFDTAKDFVQYVGRAMRSEVDQNETFVLDGMFNMFRTKYRRLIPSWIWAAVKVVDHLPEPLEALK